MSFSSFFFFFFFFFPKYGRDLKDKKKKKKKKKRGKHEFELKREFGCCSYCYELKLHSVYFCSMKNLEERH